VQGSLVHLSSWRDELAAFFIAQPPSKRLSLEQAMRCGDDEMQPNIPNSGSSSVDDVDENIEISSAVKLKIE
jgi:hypothetical protein